ncbi:MAG: glycosyltransferase family 39 protein [Gemmatimonadota bacterium]
MNTGAGAAQPRPSIGLTAGRYGNFLYIFTLALLVRLIGYVLFQLWLYDGRLTHPDSALYHAQAKSAFAPALTAIFHKGGYSTFLDSLYSLFGPYHVLGELSNLLLGALLVAVGYRVAARHFGQRSGAVAGLLLVFDPGLVYWSTQLLKDTLLWLAFLIAVDFMFNHELAWKRSLPGAAIALVGLATLRPELGFLMVLVFAAFVFEPGKLRSAPVIVLLTFAAIGANFVVRPWLEIHFSGDRVPTEAVLEMINSFRASTNVRSHVEFFAESLPKTLFESPGEVALFVLKIPVLFLTVPHPWHANALSEILFLPNVIYWYTIGALSLAGIAKSAPLGRAHWALLGLIVIVVLPLTMLITSTAAYVRWRVPAGLVLTLFAGHGAVQLFDRVRNRRPPASSELGEP